jgi:hypothetical protein
VRGVPPAGETAGVGKLGGVHQACSLVASSDGVLSPLTGLSCGQEVEPHVRLHVVLRDALASPMETGRPPGQSLTRSPNPRVGANVNLGYAARSPRNQLENDPARREAACSGAFIGPAVQDSWANVISPI